MSILLSEPFTGGAAVLGNPPWTQQETVTINKDGGGRGKASGVDASNDLFAFDNAGVYAVDQYALMTIIAGLASGDGYAFVTVRASGTGAGKNNYYLATDGVNGAAHTTIGKYVANVQTGLLSLSPAAPFALNDRMKLVATGVNPTTLEAFKALAASPTVWVSLGTITDSDHDSGAAGLGLYNGTSNNITFDDWEGGNIDAVVPVVPRALEVSGYQRRSVAPSQRMG